MKRMTLAIVLACASAAHGVTIVQDGEPAAVIVLDRRPHPVAFEAAIELQRVLKRISGAKLPIYLENEFHNGHESPRRFTPRIFVGESQSAREAGLDLADLPPEGFKVMQTSFSPVRPSPDAPLVRPPKNTYTAIILAGRDEDAQNWMWRGDRANRHTRGTAYAVYNFLEQDLGVRWLWPGELGEVVPQMKTVTVNPKNRSDAPKLRKRIVRNYFDYSIPDSWRARSKLGNYGIHTRLAAESDLWLDHMGLGDSLPQWQVNTEGRRGWVEKFGKDHPEWFAMQSDGSRLVQELLGRVRICHANPQVIEQILKEADAFFEKHPNQLMYGIELSDNFGSYCQCDLCKAWGPTQSDIVARHWAAIGEKFAKRHPDKLLYAHPYDTYFNAPTNVTRLPDNIMLWPVGKNVHGYTAEADRQASLNSWVGWSKLNKQKMVWRPNFGHNDVGYPLNYARRLAADIKLFYKHKLAGTDIDCLRRHYAGTGLTYYVYTRLFWDPTRDVDAMIRDYCEKGFGPAADKIEAYFNYLEKLTTDIAQKEQTGFSPIGLPGGDTGSFGVALHFTPAVVKKLNTMLDQAAAAAGDDETIKQRIAFLRVAVDYVDLERRVITAGQEASDMDMTQAQVDALRNLLKERDNFLRALDGGFTISLEASMRGADWIQDVIKDQEDRLAGIDDFSDLWLANDFVMNLPTEWKFKTDPKGAGAKEKWFAIDFNDAAWETLKIGNDQDRQDQFWDIQGYRDYDGIAWYRRKITLPATLEGKPVLFAFGAVDETAMVYIDGQLAGEHDIGPLGWDKRFILDLTKHIKPGVEQTWAIRVLDSDRAGGIWKPVKVITPKTKGESQSLILQPTKDAWIRSNYPDQPYGKDPSLAIGTNDIFRTLIAWELPASLKTAKIHAAKIVLSLRYATNPGSYVMQPFPTHWQERTVTWNQRDAKNPWGKEGLAPKQAVIATVKFDRGMKQQEVEKMSSPPTAEFDVTPYMRSRGAKMKNFGVMIRQLPQDPEAYISPHSREADDEKLRPRLVIEYEIR